MNARKFEIAQSRRFGRTAKRLATGVSLMAMGAAANAADWSSTTGAIDFSGEITAVQAIIGIVATVIVVMVGGKFLLSALRKG